MAQLFLIKYMSAVIEHNLLVRFLLKGDSIVFVKETIFDLS